MLCYENQLYCVCCAVLWYSFGIAIHYILFIWLCNWSSALILDPLVYLHVNKKNQISSAHGIVINSLPIWCGFHIEWNGNWKCAPVTIDCKDGKGCSSLQLNTPRTCTVCYNTCNVYYVYLLPIGNDVNSVSQILTYVGYSLAPVF